MPIYDRFRDSDGALVESRSFRSAPSTVGVPVKGFVWQLQAKPATDDFSTVAWNTSSRAWASTLKSLADCKAVKKAKLAAYRYDREVGGATATIASTDYAIDTSRDSQALIDGTHRALVDGVMASVKFKTAAGAILTANAAAMATIRSTVTLHVQACREKEADLAQAIDALTTKAAVINYDIAAQWEA